MGNESAEEPSGNQNIIRVKMLQRKSAPVPRDAEKIIEKFYDLRYTPTLSVRG